MKYLMLLVFLIMNPLFASEWSSTSLSLLRGTGFELGDKNKTEFTLEQANGLKFGDSFLWLDVTDPQVSSEDKNKKTELYGEWSPRVSLGKIFKFYNRDRFFQDVLPAAIFEFGNSGVSTRSRLLGISFDLKIPYSKFFNASIYLRDNLRSKGTTSQFSLVYEFPINVSRLRFVYGAYIDFVLGDEGSTLDNDLVESHWQTGQQFLFDLGSVFNVEETLYMGVEYQYWSRKYGISGGPVENNLKWMIKWFL